MTHPTWTDRLARLVDTALDRSVVLGYPATGHAVRRRLSTWPKDPPRNALSGKHVLVTGASSGLGVRTAVDLAMLGAHVHLVVRDPMKAAPVREQLADSDELLVAWKTTADGVARELERDMIAEFKTTHSKRPFANLTG